MNEISIPTILQVKIRIEPRIFHFKSPAGTSRGIYTTRRSWLVYATSPLYPNRCGVGECAPLPQLSCDDLADYEKTLRTLCDMVEQQGSIDYGIMRPYPSMLFGLETALLHLAQGSTVLFDTAFARGEVSIPVNGLVWMGRHDEMLTRMEEKIAQGFRCIKLKIGAINFEEELDLVKRLRDRFSIRELQLRVDANGAFTVEEALYKLELLAQYGIHSIEQPIKPKQWGVMAMLCRESPLPIALDEELIGVNLPEMKRQMLNIIKPAYVVLKPSLHGGMHGVREWISIARDMSIDSWITSALESNVGLNAIAQLTAHLYGTHITQAQGVGTGMLYTDNVPWQGQEMFIKEGEAWMRTAE
ncbi:MAG: o-succinylbenzoate synthase [Prevotella sp.]